MNFSPVATTRIDHVGLVVDDIEPIAALLTGIGFVERRRVERENLRAVFLGCGDVEVEVLQILDPAERERRLGDARSRLEHVAVEVDDLEATIVELERLGGRAAAPIRETERYRMFFTDPGSTHGVTLQFVEPARRSPQVIRSADGDFADRGGGVRTTLLATSSRGATHFITGMTIFDPGASVPLHSHNCDESVTVLEGVARFEADGVEEQLRPYDATLVPAGRNHRFLNAGDTALRILFVYASADATRTIAETSETHSIASEHARGRTVET